MQDCGQNLSAEETPEKNGARFQKAYENCQRQKSIEEKTCKGQKALKLQILSMNEYAKKYVCIKKDKEFRFLFKKGDSIVTDAFVCYARESKRRVNRIGIVTGKKVGNAVKRSRARRVIREAFRLIEPLLREKTQKRYDFIFVARAKTPAMKSTEVYLRMEKQLLKRYATPANNQPDKIQK